jgi:hypothetical protein
VTKAPRIAAAAGLLAGLASASGASAYQGWVYNCTEHTMRVFANGRQVCHVGEDEMCTLDLPAGRYLVRAELSDGRYIEQTYDIPADVIHFRTPCSGDDLFSPDPEED